MPDLMLIGEKKYPEELFYLEPTWKQVVLTEVSRSRNHVSVSFLWLKVNTIIQLLFWTVLQNLSKKECDQQQGIWELLRTEIEYIRDLKIVRDVSFGR